MKNIDKIERLEEELALLKASIKAGKEPIQEPILCSNPEFELPQPSQAFIKAYCEQGGIDEVDVEYERVSAFEQRGLPSRLKINILKVDPVHNTITTHRIVEKVYN